MQVETQIGNYFVTCMLFPAFPRPNEPGRVHLYASHLVTNKPFRGEITFKVRDDSWFGDAREEVLGTQLLDDNVYRQGFIFKEQGDYVITASFEAEGEPYTIDFPVRVGDPSWVGPIGITVSIIAILLITVNIIQRKRSLKDKLIEAHNIEKDKS